MGYLHCSICPPSGEIKKLWNTSLVPIQWAKPHDATKMPQLLCVKLEDPKKNTSQALRRSRAVIHLTKTEPFKLDNARKRDFAAAARVLFVLAIIKNKVFCQLMLGFQRDMSSELMPDLHHQNARK